jgi:hypothetical protein
MVKAIKDFKEDIVCFRDASGQHVNIPGQAAAENLYHDFKWEFIATMLCEGGTIPREKILNWVKEKQKGHL